MTRKKQVLYLIALIGTSLMGQVQQPNVVIIYADDMGFSDVGAYADLDDLQSPGSTPNMDTLAEQGMMFTQAHSSSAVCTPSRYGLLTGIYDWRMLASGVSSHYAAPEIPDGDITIAEYLKTKGYQTAAFGKWHLGGYFYNPSGEAYDARSSTITNPDNVDWEHPVDGHAVDHGFDYFRGLVNTINFAPYVYLEGKRIQYFDPDINTYRNALNTDTYRLFTANQLADGLTTGRDGRTGLGDPSYTQIDAGPILVNDVEEYISSRVGDSKPFFVYASLYSPHKPWHVTPDFKESENTLYGDFMHEVDDRIGRIIKAIDNNGFSDNTIVIITSDNGPETTAVQVVGAVGRDANGPFRGIKRDSWEGGTRVPFIIRWPGVVESGTISNQLIWQGDIFKTLSEYFGDCLPENVAPDATNILPILEGNAIGISRNPVVNSTVAQQLSIKTDDGWKLIDGTGGGGNSSFSIDANNIQINNPKGVIGGDPKQLFNLNDDIGEENNLIAIELAKANEMLDLLDSERAKSVIHPNGLRLIMLSESVTVGAELPTDPELEGDFVLRERRPIDNDARRHISGFVKFNLSDNGITSMAQNDRYILEVQLRDRLNKVHASSLHVGRITTSDWTTNNPPSYNYATASQAAFGTGTQVDERVLIEDIGKANLNCLYSIDVTDYVRQWVDGTTPNYGFGLYLSDEYNGVSLENIKLIAYQPGNTSCNGGDVDLSLHNLALGKPADQSTDFHNGGDASLAVDNNTDGKWTNGSVTHTLDAGSAQPWWRVDLGATYVIGDINVFNRTDARCRGVGSCPDRLKGAKVYVGNVNSNDPSDYEEVATLTEAIEQNLGGLSVTGRYVMVRHEGSSKILSLAEVQVYGSLAQVQNSVANAVKMETGIHIYPNPVAEVVTVTVNTPSEMLGYQIMGLDGRVYLQGNEKLEHSADTLELNIEGLPSGIYVLQVSDGQITSETKIIKQ